MKLFSDKKEIQSEVVGAKKNCVRICNIMDKSNSRIRQGMLPVSDLDLQNSKFSNCRTRSQLLKHRKEILLEANSLIADYSFKTADARLVEREQVKNITPPPGITYKILQQDRKASDFHHLIETFGKQSIGIHKDLPKFSENLKEYWKRSSENPMKSSKSSESPPKAYFRRTFKTKISETPTKLEFSHESYQFRSKFARKHDWNVGVISSSKQERTPRVKTVASRSRKKIYLNIESDFYSNPPIRSRGFTPISV